MLCVGNCDIDCVRNPMTWVLTFELYAASEGVEGIVGMLYCWVSLPLFFFILTINIIRINRLKFKSLLSIIAYIPQFILTRENDTEWRYLNLIRLYLYYYLKIVNYILCIYITNLFFIILNSAFGLRGKYL